MFTSIIVWIVPAAKDYLSHPATPRRAPLANFNYFDAISPNAIQWRNVVGVISMIGFLGSACWLLFLFINTRTRRLRNRIWTTVCGAGVGLLIWITCGQIIGIANDFTWVKPWEEIKMLCLVLLVVLEAALGFLLAPRN